jgi:hypothetical protein
MRIRTYIGSLLIKAGMAVTPKDVRDLVRNTLLYHVPDALTSEEKSEVEAFAKYMKRN